MNHVPIFYMASADPSSAAYNFGYILGMILMAIFLIGLPVLFILSLVKLVTTKKKAWLVGLITSTVLILALIGAIGYAMLEGVKSGAYASGKSKTSGSLGAAKTVQVQDSKLSLSQPKHWRTLTGINEDASYTAGNTLKEEYFIVIHEPKVDFDGTVQEYSEIACDSIFTSITNGSMTEPISITLNGLPAVQREISGSIGRIKIAYLHTTVEGADQYYQLLGWTISSRKTAAMKVINEVVNSCKE